MIYKTILCWIYLIIYKVNMLSILLRELPSSHPSVSRELTLQQCRFTEHLNKQANSSLFRAEPQLQNLTWDLSFLNKTFPIGFFFKIILGMVSNQLEEGGTIEKKSMTIIEGYYRSVQLSIGNLKWKHFNQRLVEIIWYNFVHFSIGVLLSLLLSKELKLKTICV